MTSARIVRGSLRLVTGLAIAFCGCATTEQDWEAARKQGTVSGYERYLEMHPDSPHARFARGQIDGLELEADWESARSEDTIQAYEKFTEAHPSSRYDRTAGRRIRELTADRDWQSTQAKGTIAAYEQYLKRHDAPRRSRLAREKLAELLRKAEMPEWALAQEKDTVAAYEAFLEHYGSTARGAKARERLATLRAEDERDLMERLRKAVANAEKWPALLVDRHDYLKNIVVEAAGSILEYGGANLQAAGVPYAKVPSKGSTWQVVHEEQFLILQLENVPSGVKDVLAHTGGSEIPIGFVVHPGQRLTLVIPREILPCEIELRGLLYGRIEVRE